MDAGLRDMIWFKPFGMLTQEHTFFRHFCHWKEAHHRHLIRVGITWACLELAHVTTCNAKTCVTSLPVQPKVLESIPSDGQMSRHLKPQTTVVAWSTFPPHQGRWTVQSHLPPEQMGDVVSESCNGSTRMCKLPGGTRLVCTKEPRTGQTKGFQRQQRPTFCPRKAQLTLSECPSCLFSVSMVWS